MSSNRNRKLRLYSRHPTHNVLRGLINVSTPTVLRLGSQTASSVGVTEINTVEAVRNSSNKLIMKRIFREAGISSPMFYESFDNDTIDTLGYPLLAKRSFRSRGDGMKFITNREELDAFITRYITNNTRNTTNPYYLEKYHNYTREYRLHITNDGCFYACRKLRRTDAQGTWFRNDSNSIWTPEYRLIKDENNVIIGYDKSIDNQQFNKPATWDGIVQDCINAKNSLGLDICCFDVLVNKKGNHLILESNSAPSFGKITEMLYIEELNRMVTTQINNPTNV